VIGVAVSTHRRPAVLAKALAGWASTEMPDVLVVNNDVNGAGVAATKNRGIAALMDAGCTHLFLADDDVWPLQSHWWSPYVRHAEPHLMHCWGRSRFRSNDLTNNVSIWSWPRGVLLYVTREVVAAVGGMRIEFGRWGGEHAEWSRRIHNAGFTTYPFQDALNAPRWHCEDYTRTTPSSVPSRVRDSEANTRRRHALIDQHRSSKEFVPYRREQANERA
jgi:GT2 family glycosyltransferase